MRICGVIHSVDIFNKLIAIKQYKKLEFFYFQNSQMNLFKRYLYNGNIIDLEYDEETIYRRKKHIAYLVSYVNKLYLPSKYESVVYYDKRNLNQSLSKFLSALGNVLVLDLEMTMPSYSVNHEPFKPEIIQAGYLLLNGEGDEICRYSNYVKPHLSETLSKRVCKFLNIDQLDFDSKAISYQSFYDEFSHLIEEYNPVILVYGKNDIIVLNDSYSINGVPSLKNKTRFVNLCQLIKNFYDLRNDPGLFKLYQIYYDINETQIHDAFNDCEVTSLVFKAFKDEVNKKTHKGDDVRRELD